MKPILTIAFCLLVFSSALADGPRKFDEYVGLPFSDEKPRLDNLAAQLQRYPDSVAWYFIFAGRKTCPGEARLRAIRAKIYLVKKHGIRADRIIWIDEGYRNNLVVEIWVPPRSAGKPLPTNTSLDRNEVQIGMGCKSKSHKQQRRIKL